MPRHDQLDARTERHVSPSAGEPAAASDYQTTNLDVATSTPRFCNTDWPREQPDRAGPCRERLRRVLGHCRCRLSHQWHLVRLASTARPRSISSACPQIRVTTIPGRSRPGPTTPSTSTGMAAIVRSGARRVPGWPQTCATITSVARAPSLSRLLFPRSAISRVTQRRRAPPMRMPPLDARPTRAVPVHLERRARELRRYHRRRVPGLRPHRDHHRHWQKRLVQRERRGVQLLSDRLHASSRAPPTTPPISARAARGARRARPTAAPPAARSRAALACLGALACSTMQTARATLAVETT